MSSEKLMDATRSYHVAHRVLLRHAPPVKKLTKSQHLEEIITFTITVIKK